MSAESRFAEEEKENIVKALSLIAELLSQDFLSQHELTALGTYLNNTYSGLERLFRNQLVEAGIRVAASEYWHKELLQQALKAGLISPEPFEGLLDLLGFRHFHTHGYGHMLREDRLRELAALALRVIPVCLEKQT